MRRLISVALVVVTSGIAGCGYSSQTLFTSHYKSIAVDIFKNQTRYRDFEFSLANAIKNEIVQKTDMTLASHDNAETLLTGSIQSYDQYVVTEMSQDVVREIQVKITLSYEWRDLRTGKVIQKREGLSRTADAKFPLGETRDSAAAKVLTDVAEDVINDLEREW